MQFLPPLILVNQVASLVVLIAGTWLICFMKMRKFKANPLINPLVWASVIAAIVLAFNYADLDMREADINEQAVLSNHGERAEARIVSAGDAFNIRSTNGRMRGGKITCEFTDRAGKTVRATTCEQYNTKNQRVPLWEQDARWAPGKTIKIKYMPDDPSVFRLDEAVRATREGGATDRLLFAIAAWYFPVAWLGAVGYFAFLRKRHSHVPHTKLQE